MFGFFQQTKDYTDYRTLKEIIVDGGKKGGDKLQYVYEKKGKEINKTFADVAADHTDFGAYLYSLGLNGGKKIAILAENSYEWCIAYFSVLVGGNVCVPLDSRLSAKELAVQVTDCGCNALICSRSLLDVVNDMKNKFGVRLAFTFITEDFDKYYAEAKTLDPGFAESYLNAEVKENDLACIVYTSGTTGKTKGVMLSHRNVASNAVSTCKYYEGGHGLGFLPLNHTYSWVAGILFTFIESEWGYLCTNLLHIYKDIKKYKPVNFAAVPMVVEMIYKKITSDAKLNGKYDELMNGINVSRNFMMSGLDRRRELFSEIHESLGGELKYILCGGAYLKPEIEEFMYDIGIQVITGYGLTECSPCVTTSRTYDFKFGSVGLVLDCNEVKINAPDENGIGEIYAKGENVMMGYYGDEAATASAFDGEWLKTGDLGYLDDEGFLFFTGRKKNLIILSNGKNVSPEEIEDELTSEIEYIKEVLVYEENGKITGEFFLDKENYPGCEENIRADIDKFNAGIAEFKRINVVKLREEEFSKTTTLKIIRKY